MMRPHHAAWGVVVHHRKRPHASALIYLFLLLVPVMVRAADMGIGASARYSWWDPYWSQMADTRVFPGTKFEFNVLPSITVKPDFSGGPLLNVGIDDTWGLFASYAYGAYRGESSGLLLNPLYYYIEQPVTTKREARRHEFSFSVSARLHDYVKLFGGVVYSGYSMYTEASVFVPETPFFYSSTNRVFHHFAGPAVGVDFIIPLVSTLYLLPGCSAVFQFSRFVGEKKDFVSEMINASFMGTETTLLYAGLNFTLSLAYYIRQIGMTVALGGRFHYLWIRDIEKGYFVADNKHDMFGGVHCTFVYTFNLTASPGRATEGPVPLPKLQ